jgi:hypothetical protein
VSADLFYVWLIVKTQTTMLVFPASDQMFSVFFGVLLDLSLYISGYPPASIDNLTRCQSINALLFTCNCPLPNSALFLTMSTTRSASKRSVSSHFRTSLFHPSTTAQLRLPKSQLSRSKSMFMLTFDVHCVLSPFPRSFAYGRIDPFCHVADLLRLPANTLTPLQIKKTVPRSRTSAFFCLPLSLLHVLFVYTGPAIFSL